MPMVVVHVASGRDNKITNALSQFLPDTVCWICLDDELQEPLYMARVLMQR